MIIKREQKKVERAKRWIKFNKETGRKAVFNLGQTRKAFHDWQKENYENVL